MKNKKTLKELTDLYKTMKSKYEKDLTTRTLNWEINHKKDFINAPDSVQFVKMMAVMGQPVGLEIFERALKEGPEWFPEEIEYRQKWDLIPQAVKDAYFADPNHSLFSIGKDTDEPIELQNWPGIIAATDEDWRISKEWHASDKYKAKQLARNKLKVETYNKYFSEYGLTSFLSDYHTNDPTETKAL